MESMRIRIYELQPTEIELPLLEIIRGREIINRLTFALLLNQ